MPVAPERPVHAPLGERAATLRRIPSLDGLRALSIIMVMGLHTIQRMETERPVFLLWPTVFNGSLGVSIFFVISGYLITRLLLHEAGTRGDISLGGFYLKRAFRILPPLYAYVGVLLALSAAGRLALTRIDVLSALFFFHNYALHSTSWAIEHFWTLSVEEQFYLLWPVILIACLRSSATLGSRRAATVAIVVMLLSPIVRVLSFRTHQPLLHNGAGFHMHADMLAFGCVGALLEGRRRFERLYRSLTRLPWLPFLAVALGSFLEVRFQNYWSFPFGETYTGLFLITLLLWCVRNPDTLAGRLLNHPVVTHLGVLSYSIYIWQTLLLHRLNATVFQGAAWIGHLPQSWLAVLLFAELSFFLVEKPSLGLRNRLLRRNHLFRPAPVRHPLEHPVSSGE